MYPLNLANWRRYQEIKKPRSAVLDTEPGTTVIAGTEVTAVHGVHAECPCSRYQMVSILKAKEQSGKPG